jgi:allophanate hydrolase subunit 1
MTLNDAAEAAQKAASVATYGGSGTAIYFGFSPGEWQAIGIVGGWVFAAAGWATNFYFKRQHLLLAKAKAQPDPEQ